MSDAEGRFDEDWREVLPASYHGSLWSANPRTGVLFEAVPAP
ncbi:hypothetical protein ACLESO_01925 [Pyxidicoccus sp. 3LG]